MFIEFLMRLKEAQVPVTPRDLLVLLQALEARVAFGRADEFYSLARLCLVKRETDFDKFDQVFAEYFRGGTSFAEKDFRRIQEGWLKKGAGKFFTEEQMLPARGLGDGEKLMEALQQRLEEQMERPQDGSKWVGTDGISPSGAFGYNPEGVHVGQNESSRRSAAKVWDKREFKDLDDGVELGTRNIKLALRRLRKFAREGAAEELDLPGTIRATAGNAGHLDLRMVPRRHNNVKVLMFFDVGGSMETYIQLCEELFSAARSEFRYLKYFYFHNFIYENVWRSNWRRNEEQFSVLDIIRTFGPDYKLIFVGDAVMSLSEIDSVGGSLDHDNAEPGARWLQRLTEHYARSVWLNPTPEKYWDRGRSIKAIRCLMGARMYPLTLAGLDRSVRNLNQ